MPLRNTQNRSKTRQKAWKRVRSIQEITRKPLKTCWKVLRNITDTGKNAIDTFTRTGKISQLMLKSIQNNLELIEKHYEPALGLRRPSKGDPTRPVRAGAPNEYLPTPPQPKLYKIKTLLAIKQLCQKHFNSDYNQLAECTKTLGNLLK